ncbi:MAG TPA: hypothetical protein VFN97_14570 [Actinospica sp.]|nr:hypothetical protein [Actinospica sp.]
MLAAKRAIMPVPVHGDLGMHNMAVALQNTGIGADDELWQLTPIS